MSEILIAIALGVALFALISRRKQRIPAKPARYSRYDSADEQLMDTALGLSGPAGHSIDAKKARQTPR